jgi:hypothetical protein
MMSVLIFRLNGVEPEEAQEVRDLLEQNQLDFYETSAGRWGISVAGIWLQDETRADEARALLDQYARQRQVNVRQQYQQSRDRGQHLTLWQRALDAPVRTIAILLLAGTVAYLSIWPFINMME